MVDPATIIAGIRQFGLAPDGSDLRDLEAVYEALERENERLRRLDAASESTFTAWRSRAVTAERQLAEARAAHQKTSHKAVKRLRALWREKEAAEAERDRLREALSKPTPAMIEDGVLAYNLTGIAGGIVNTAEYHVEFIWQAIFAAIQKEPQP